MTAADYDDVFVTPEDIKAAAESSGFLLTIPADAARKGDPAEDGGKATWKQEFVIGAVTLETGAEIKGKEGDPVYIGTVVTVDFTIPPDAARINKTTGEFVPDPNAGRSLRAWYKLVKDAQGNKEHPKYKAFNFNMSRLKGIIESAGWQLPEGGFSLKQFFGSDVLLNAKVNTMVTRSWFNGKPKDEVSDFITPKVAAA